MNLSTDSARYLRHITAAGLAILDRQSRSYHAAGFAQDVPADDGTLLHAELTSDGFWHITVADTGEYVSLFYSP